MVALSHAVLDAALDSAEYTLQYESSKYAIELLVKDEDIRRLHAKLLIIEDDNSELQSQLQYQQECSQRFRGMVDEHLARAQAAEITLSAHEQQARTHHHDISRLQQELAALRTTSHDHNGLLAEKLAQAHELSLLRPEVQHLRAQIASVEGLVSEKLALQRQLADMKCDLASAKADAKRAQAKRRNTTMEIAQEEQLEDLKKQLAREKRARKNAEETMDQTQGNDDVGRELAKEKNQREQLQEELEAMKANTQVEDMRRDLFKAKKAMQSLQDQNDTLRRQLDMTQQADSTVGQSKATDSSQTDLARLRAEQSQVEADAARKEEQWDIEKSALDEKLNQFRTKLRETKELLKSTKEELAAVTERAERAERGAQTAAMEAAVIQVTAPKTTVKRTARVADPVADETSLGTPGDAPQAKRARKANAAIGSKSAFSITPFLNKTTVLDEKNALDTEAEDSPTKPKVRQPLAEAESIKANTAYKSPDKPSDEPKDSKTPVDVVETISKPTNRARNTEQQAEKPTSKIVSKAKKSRKSLVDFESFQKGDNEPVVKQKKRKLGGPGPTLFDDDEENGPVTAQRMSFANRSLFRTTPGNRLNSIKKQGTSRSALLTASDGTGFQFSPLRRNRTNIDDTLKA